MHFQARILLLLVIEKIRHDRLVVLDILAQRDRYRLTSSRPRVTTGPHRHVVEIRQSSVRKTLSSNRVALRTEAIAGTGSEQTDDEAEYCAARPTKDGHFQLLRGRSSVTKAYRASLFGRRQESIEFKVTAAVTERPVSFLLHFKEVGATGKHRRCSRRLAI